MASTKEDRYIIFEPTRHGIRAGYAGTSDPRCVLHPVDYRQGSTVESLKSAMAAAYRTIGAAEQPALLLLPNGMPRPLVSRYVQAVFETTATSQAAIVWRSVAAVLATNCMTGLFVDCEGPPGSAVVVPVIDGLPIRHAATVCNETVISEPLAEDSTLAEESAASSTFPTQPSMRDVLSTALSRAGPSIATRVLPAIVVVSDNVAAREADVAVALGTDPTEDSPPSDGDLGLNNAMSLATTDDAFGGAIGPNAGSDDDKTQQNTLSNSLAKFRRIPTFLEYYASRPELTPYLGACLLAKQVFSDSRSYLARSEFETNGSRGIFSRFPGSS